MNLCSLTKAKRLRQIIFLFPREPLNFLALMFLYDSLFLRVTVFPEDLFGAILVLGCDLGGLNSTHMPASWEDHVEQVL